MTDHAVLRYTTRTRCDECGDHVGQQCSVMGHAVREALFLDVSDPEALSGLVAYAIDANHGRPTFAIARAVIDELLAEAPAPCGGAAGRRPDEV